MRVRTLGRRLVPIACLLPLALISSCTTSIPGPAPGSTVAPGRSGLHLILEQARARLPLLDHICDNRFKVLTWESVGGSELVILSLDGAQMPGRTGVSEQRYAERLQPFIAARPVVPVNADIGNPQDLQLSYQLRPQTPQRIHVVIITNHHALMLVNTPLVGKGYGPSTTTLASETVTMLQPEGETPVNQVDEGVEMCQSLVYVATSSASADLIQRLWSASSTSTENLSKLYQNEQLFGQEVVCNTAGHVLENGLYHFPWSTYVNLVAPGVGFSAEMDGVPLVGGQWPLTKRQFELLTQL